VDLLRQSVYSRIAGYEDVAGAGRLSQSPVFRLIDSEKIWDRGAALTSRLQTFETGIPPAYCQQEHSAYNGHFESTCYHPLLLFNREGDCLGGKAETRQRPQRRRCFRQAGDIRSPVGARREVGHPHPGR